MLQPCSAAVPGNLTENRIRNGAAGPDPVPIWDADGAGSSFMQMPQWAAFSTVLDALRALQCIVLLVRKTSNQRLVSIWCGITNSFPSDLVSSCDSFPLIQNHL